MGAWGEGMQASDSALDAIDNFRQWDGKKNRFVPNKRGRAVITGEVSLLAELRAVKQKARYDWAQKVLGVAEFFLERGVDMKASRAFVRSAIKQQRGKREMETWCNMEARRAALDRFERRLDGKPVKASEVAADNEGLLSRMSRSR